MVKNSHAVNVCKPPVSWLGLGPAQHLPSFYKCWFGGGICEHHFTSSKSIYKWFYDLDILLQILTFIKNWRQRTQPQHLPCLKYSRRRRASRQTRCMACFFHIRNMKWCVFVFVRSISCGSILGTLSGFSQCQWHWYIEKRGKVQVNWMSIVLKVPYCRKIWILS